MHLSLWEAAARLHAVIHTKERLGEQRRERERELVRKEKYSIDVEDGLLIMERFTVSEREKVERNDF